jgi:hypothetical protein
MRITIALFAIVSIGMVLPTASARGRFHGGSSVRWNGPWGSSYRWHGADWWGGYGYASYYGSDSCYLVWQRFWDGYGWRLRSVPVCG